MDFDIAATRLRNDQSSALARSRASKMALRASASSKSRRMAEKARDDAERRIRTRKLEIERDRRAVDAIYCILGNVERDLGVVNVGVGVGGGGSGSGSGRGGTTTTTESSSSSSPFVARRPWSGDGMPMSTGWKLTPSSIHGDGDKISLPPSVLAALMTSGEMGGNDGRPIAFRIGVPDPDYAFPASDKMRDMIEDVRRRTSSDEEGGAMTTTDDDDKDDDDDDDIDVDAEARVEAYLDELSYRYLTYTHGTVVEFTEEEGSVGLPYRVALSLLRPNSNSLARRDRGRGKGRTRRTDEDDDDKDDDDVVVVLPARRTIDPSSSSSASSSGGRNGMEVDDGGNDEDRDGTGGGEGTDHDGERTPGHPAYGLFDVPDVAIEIVPITRLPPGRHCTFVPTSESVKNGFQHLKDVENVLERSLSRARATLTRGDVVRAWRRGVPYDLIVRDVSPSSYGAVCCVNTDLNVDIDPPEGTASRPTAGGVGGVGTSSSSSSSSRSVPSAVAAASPLPRPLIILPSEPAEDAKVGVCVVQVRGRSSDGNGASSGRRRFDVAGSTLAHLFAFASDVCGGIDPLTFRLVTRFPRRSFALSSSLSGQEEEEEEGRFDADATLESVGICQGQEMFMVESM